MDLDANDFSEYELNGREIRNIINAAQTLANSENKKIHKDHMTQIIGMVQEFQRDMEEMRSRGLDYPEISDDEKVKELGRNQWQKGNEYN